MSVDVHMMIAFLVTILAGAIIIVLRTKIEAITPRRKDHLAVQCSHIGNPLRLGGFTIFTGLFAGVSSYTFGEFEQKEVLMLLSIIPVFAAGALEDLGYGVSPLGRFLAAVVSAAIAVYFLKAWVSRMDVPGIDLAMAIPFVGILFTVLFSAGFCHAVNLIDGMNGLAVFNIGISAIGCTVVAELAGIDSVQLISMLLAVACAGFVLFNWPFAKLFLGDAGAYGLGHVIVWQVFMLVALSSDVAIPAAALLIFWPLADVVHTIGRRIASGKSILKPDRMHLHQKVRRVLDMLWFGKQGRHISNPLATILLVPLMSAPVLCGVLLWNNKPAAWFAFVAFLIMFSAAHLVTFQIASTPRLKAGMFLTARITQPSVYQRSQSDDM